VGLKTLPSQASWLPAYSCGFSAAALETLSAADLIQKAQEHPPQPIIEGIINIGDILLVHGLEESFKSVFILQVAECIAKGQPLFSFFPVPHVKRVGIIETEIHEAMLGDRLAKMSSAGHPPENMCFLSANTMRGWRRLDMRSKFEFIKRWIDQQRISVLVIDIATDFFRGDDNPSDERHAGGFFDETRNMGLEGCILVRHDRKRRESDKDNHPNEQIRGSAEWKEDPEAIVALTRVDKRTHQVIFDVGKMRYGSKPDPIDLWFDAGEFRLTALPPVIALLLTGAKTRAELGSAFQDRFNVQERLTDTMIGEQSGYLLHGQRGHERTWELNLDNIHDAQWAKFLPKAVRRR
jgi:RecA-family ATPase